MRSSWVCQWHSSVLWKYEIGLSKRRRRYHIHTESVVRLLNMLLPNDKRGFSVRLSKDGSLLLRRVIRLFSRHERVTNIHASMPARTTTTKFTLQSIHSSWASFLVLSPKARPRFKSQVSSSRAQSKPVRTRDESQILTLGPVPAFATASIGNGRSLRA